LNQGLELCLIAGFKVKRQQIDLELLPDSFKIECIEALQRIFDSPIQAALSEIKMAIPGS